MNNKPTIKDILNLTRFNALVPLSRSHFLLAENETLSAKK